MLWLPVKRRVHLKILIATYKCIYGEAPKYLCNLLLRSPSQILMPVPVSTLKCYGDCAGQSLRNRLPERVKNAMSLGIYKSTQLFKIYHIFFISFGFKELQIGECDRFITKSWDYIFTDLLILMTKTLQSAVRHTTSQRT